MNTLKFLLLRGMQGLIISTLLLLTGSVLAQAPQAFKYQAVVRNIDGEPIASSNVSVRMSIIIDNPEGNAIYREVHNLTTSPLGLITLDIGNGNPLLGSFNDIVWGLGNYFIKIEVDPNGGNDFIFMGTSQLLSVPYAIYAREAGGPPSYTWAQLQEYLRGRSTPTPGMMVYVTDENRMVYYNGTQWVTTNEECFPPPTTANAGPDQIDVEGTSTYLEANDPKHGSGLWSIISEDNGSIVSLSDYGDPNALLTTTGGNFVLQWTVTNECGESIDQVYISFCPPNTIANAGVDQFSIIGTSAQLAANEPEIGNTGIWSITNGTGGSFSNINDPLSTFSGLPGVTYTLRWTIATGCDSNFDELQIGFCHTLTIANAGADQINVSGTSTTLQGNQPGTGNSGLWTIVSGQGGHIVNPSVRNSIFNGLPNETYILRWTIHSDCQNSFDEVVISFCPVLTIANAGPDQLNLSATSTTLAGNLPGVANTGVWAIVSGIGGSFADPNDPVTIFNGQPGATYVLSWTISTVCSSSSDQVTIGFCPELVTADAGPDAFIACIPHTLAANNPGAGNSGQWTIISGAGGSFSNPNSPTTNFTGVAGVTYELQWTISNACGSSSDNVTVSFEPYPCMANAGPDQLNIEGTTVILAANTPVIGTGMWSIISGLSGSFADATNPNTEFTGLAGHAYTLEWRISNACYSTFDLVNVSFVAVFGCGEDLVDERDNQVYPTVSIGTQCWMAKNLNVGTQVFMTPTNNGIIEKYCYNHQPANCETYGGLYLWTEMMNYQSTPGSQGICPPGWHIPTKAEFDILVAYLGGSQVAGGELKEVGNTYWNNNVGATNSSGFSARGSGYHSGAFYTGQLQYGPIWSSSSISGQNQYLMIGNNSTQTSIGNFLPGYSLPVRCVKN